jgi:peptidoglycan lytic transglycosylase
MLAIIRTLRWSAAVALALPLLARAQLPDGATSRASAAAYSTATPYAADPIYSSARMAFEAAYAHVEAQLPDDSASDGADLKAYPLYAYLQAARIEQALGDAPDSPAPADRQAAVFVKTHAAQPVSRELRRAWLQSLAQRALWATFLQAYRDIDAGPALRCQSFEARIALGDTDGLTHDIEAAWLTPHSLPECAPAFAWLMQRGALTLTLVARRARLALEASDPAFARQIIEQLPRGPVAEALLRWAMLLEHPEREIDVLLDSPHRSVDPDALLAGWSLLARANPQAAEKRYWRLIAARGLNRRTASPYALALALGLAWDRDPAALAYFRRVAARDLDEPAREWRVRAALWSGHWRVALRSIEALPPGERRTSRWRYWTARAEAALHHPARARRLYFSVLEDDDYYSALAAARLGRPIVPHPQALPADPAVIASIGRLAAMVRARELFLCGLEPYAQAEWRFAYRSLTAEQRLQSIHLAAKWGWYRQAIETASAQRVFDDYALLYPRPFAAEVHAAARHAQLAPALLQGVIRQESLYRVDAVSPAGALGLMQLMPQTARRTARYWGMQRPDVTDLLIPSVNIALGAAHLRTLLDRLDGQIPLALAGYNAGIHAVVRWLPAKSVPGDVWIENIPYNETREYVQRILWHSLLFAWLRDGTAQRARSWLAPVGQSAHLGPLESRTDHTGGDFRRLSWRHAHAASTALR